MPFGVAGLGAVVGILMALGLQGRRSRLGLAYALLVPAVISLAYPAGWLVNPQAVTTARAERIDQAIGRFHQDTGAYPASLEELTPGYLSFVGAPARAGMVLPGRAGLLSAGVRVLPALLRVDLPRALL